jgi:hypothetical protein
MLGGADDGSGRCNDATPLSFTGFLAHNAFGRKFFAPNLWSAVNKIDKFFENSVFLQRRLAEKWRKCIQRFCDSVPFAAPHDMSRKTRAHSTAEIIAFYTKV